jgi:hypothetical protein
MRLRHNTALGSMVLSLALLAAAGCAPRRRAVCTAICDPDKVEVDSALAPGVIAGSVLDVENDAPVVGAQIWVGFANTRNLKNALTDEEGRFLIAELPATKLDLYVRYIGYVQKKLEFDAARGTRMIIEIRRSPIRLQQLVADSSSP